MATSSFDRCIKMAGEFWIQLFSCVAEQDQRQTRPKIDRSMIGKPKDFQHIGHVGTSDLGTALASMQSQLGGKGDGHHINIQVPHIINARNIHEIQRHSITA